MSKKILIVGARSDLAVETLDMLNDIHLYEEYILTSREDDSSNELKAVSDNATWLQLDLSWSLETIISSKFLQYVTSNEFDSILYCASPYSKKRLSDSTDEEVLTHCSVISSNIFLLNTLSQRLKPQGVLLICGAIGSERFAYRKPSFESEIGNAGKATLHALHKGHLKDLSSCLYQEYQNVYIYHLNISSFSKVVGADQQNKILRCNYVARRLIKILLNPGIMENVGFNIDILSPEEKKSIKIQHEYRPNPGQGGMFKTNNLRLLSSDKVLRNSGRTYYYTHDDFIVIHEFFGLDTEIRDNLISLFSNMGLSNRHVLDSKHLKVYRYSDNKGHNRIDGLELFEKEIEKSENLNFHRDQSLASKIFEHEYIEFENIKIISNEFASFLENNKSELAEFLMQFECHNVAVDEIDRAIDLLRNIDKNQNYFQKKVHNVVAFLPINQPLYAFVCFAAIPSFMSKKVEVRPPTIMQEFFKKLERKFELNKRFNNIIVKYVSKKQFLAESQRCTDVVIFTGLYENAIHIKKSFSSDTLFIFNGSGHNPIVVSIDADVDKAVSSIMTVCLQNQGQDCAAPNAILVRREMLTAVKDKILSEAQSAANKVGSYKDKKNVIGPNSRQQTVKKIGDFFSNNIDYCIFGGQINFLERLIFPTVFEVPLMQSQNLKEFFAPVIMLHPYDNDEELKLYFEHPAYESNAMYVTLFGKSSYVSNRLKELALHNDQNIIINSDLHKVERGFLPYGGIGSRASCLFINQKKIKGATLPQRDIFLHKIASEKSFTEQQHQSQLEVRRKFT